MKKFEFFILFFIASIIFLSASLLLKTRKNSDAPNSKSNIYKLSTNIQNDDIIEVLNRYIAKNDIFEIRARHLDKLNLIKSGTPAFIYGKNDNQTDSFELAKKYGIKIIIYNLEDLKISYEELIEKEKLANELSKTHNLFYVFAPLAIHAEKYGADLAKNADAIAIQLRNYQLMDNFAQRVSEMSEEIRHSNPKVEVWVQLDVNPYISVGSSKRRSLSSGEILNEIKSIENYVDLISIYYPPDNISVVSEIFAELRK